MAQKKKRRQQSTTSVTVRNQLSTRPRTLQARPSGGGFVLVDGAPDLGLVPDDVVSCESGVDGRRYFTGVEERRPGTLSRILVEGVFCAHHTSEFVDRAGDELREQGAVSLLHRDGTLWAFWPADIPEWEVAMLVAGIAAEYGMINSIRPGRTRAQIIGSRTLSGPPVPAAA